MMNYDLKECTTPLRSADYYRVATISGIDYYTPNDEDWGAIIAVSVADQLAHDTGFFEMDDMEAPAPYDDYVQVVSNGSLMCKFEAEV